MRTIVEKYTPTFKAKYFIPRINQWNSIEIKTHLVVDQKENHLVISLRDTTQRENKIVSLEKEKNLLQDNLIASFSHELITPLNSNLSFLEQGIDSGEVPEETKEKYFRPALVSGRLLFFIISDILDYSQMIINELHLKVKPKNIRTTVSECFKIFRTKMFQKNIEFVLNFKESVPEILFADHHRIFQVLVNLLNNALQYTIKGKVEVTVLKSSKDMIKIIVEDTGIGMDTNTQIRLNNQLSKDKLNKKVHENSAGVGLGLFVSNKLAQQLNDKEEVGLEFTSERGVGSKFTFKVCDQRHHHQASSIPSLTLKSEDIEIDEKSNSDFNLDRTLREYDTRLLKNSFRFSSKSVSENLCKILIVDDEIFNVILLENFCKSFDCMTESAYNGEEALKKLSFGSDKKEAPFNMIFMDINMPVMNGFEATLAIKEEIKKREIEDIPIIGVTAYVAKHEIEKAYRCGMLEVVNKPLSKNSLLDILKRHGMV